MKKLTRFVILLLVASLALSACGEVTPTPDPGTDEITPIDLQAGYGIRGPWFELYMTNPDSPLSSQGTGGLDGPLVEAIDAARLSVDVAAYSISLNSVRYALIRAHDRGVTVRIVMESNNMDRSDVQYLLEAGVPIIGDNRQGLMHDKFMVLDRSEVWLGSMNYTDSGTYDDNNNMIRIRSTKIAENYSVEFNEMFEDNLFGPDIRAETPNPDVTVDGTRVETFFSPDDGVLTVLYNLLSEADESIYFLAFSFTSNELGEVVRDKADAGLDIKGVMDKEQIASNTGTEFDPFRQAGLDVRIDGNDGQMHHKVFIVDGKIVVMGSYNFSKSAEEKNDENIVIIFNKDIAKFFIDEFERVYAHASE
ncbi:MAG TPA: phospholipase D-like domain-containing protein [Anaerolineales bacterium]|nr:phospholipase D-like domain-containing protein [Anaerolineales bacterium]